MEKLKGYSCCGFLVFNRIVQNNIGNKKSLNFKMEITFNGLDF